MRSATARLSALTLVGIAAPAAVLAVLGYVSLRQWQTSAELLFREQARDVAVMAAQKVDMMLRVADESFLDRLQAQLAAGDDAPAALDRLVSDAPLVRRLYLVERSGRLRTLIRELTWERAAGRWQMRIGGRPVVDGVRAELIRRMGLTHMAHHRAQLGVYLRLLGVPIPGTYGPSADEPPPRD